MFDLDTNFSEHFFLKKSGKEISFCFIVWRSFEEFDGAKNGVLPEGSVAHPVIKNPKIYL